MLRFNRPSLHKTIPQSFLFFLLFLTLNGFSQHTGYKLYTVADGLVQSEVVQLHQDKKGFLWVGTKNGISRFDGTTFQTITDSAQVSRSVTLYIADLDDSAVAIVTSKGYLIYEYGKYRSRITSRIKEQGFYAGFRIRNGKLQIVMKSGTTGALYEVDRNGTRKTDAPFMHIAASMFFPETPVSFHYAPADGTIYFRDITGQLCCVRDKRLVKIGIFPGDILTQGNDGFLYCFTPDIEKVKLSRIFTRNGFQRKVNDDDEPVKLYRLQDTLAEQVYDFGPDYDQLQSILMCKDKNHFLTANGNTGSVSIYHDQRQSAYQYDLNISGTVFCDREGNYWFGTALGLVKSFPLCFSNYTDKEGLFPNGQFVAEDKLGNIVTGSYEKGFQVLENGRFHYVPFPINADVHEPTVVYPGGRKDRFGNVVVCVAPFTALKWDGQRFSHEAGLASSAALSFYEDIPYSMDYFGTTIGFITKPWGKTATLAPVTPGNKTNKIVAMIRDGMGRLILGGFHGVSFVEGDRVRHLPDKEFPFGKGANAMVKDQRNNIWIGNNDGLYLFDNHKFRKVANPWFNDMVVSLCMVDSATLFVGGIRGIGFLDLQRFYRDDTAVIRYFDRDNGFIGMECQQNAAITDHAGNLWITTTNSMVKIDPRELPVTDKVPLIHISGVSVIDVNMKQTPLISSEVSTGELFLKNYQNNLRFDFTGIWFSAPGHIRYRYMLEGQETNWSDPGTERYAVYTNLAPGDYRFKVMAANDEGRWSEESAMIAIHIHPAIWQTWWFWCAVALFGIITTAIFTWLISRRIRLKQQHELETRKTIAELQFKTLRNQLAPHFIFNALNVIGASVFMKTSQETYDLLHKFSRLIRQSLLHADKNNRTLAEELEFVKSYLEIEAIRFEDRINHEFIISPDVSLENLVPRMIIQTFVENAVKHGLMHKPGKGHIRVSIRNRQNALFIEVEDDGIGRAASTQFKGDSTGKGMEIIREFIRLFNTFNDSKIEVEILDLLTPTGEAAGTRVHILIPLKYSYSLTHEKSNP